MNADSAYNRGCEETVQIVRTLIAGGVRPRFAFPPKEIAVVASLEQVPGLSLNDDAKLVVSTLCNLVAGGCSVMMLMVVLEHLKVPFERVSLRELGLDGTIVPLSKGGQS